jgi:hypothetical protein
VSSDVGANLVTINELSRLLLSQFSIQREMTEGNDVQQSKVRQPSSETSPENTNNSQFTDETLINLVSERNNLIKQLFEMYTQEQLSVELPLINEMVSLDQQLTSKSHKTKQALSAQVLKLRKNKKVTNLYQQLNQNLNQKY